MKKINSIKTQVLFISFLFIFLFISLISGCSDRSNLTREEIKDLEVKIAALEERTEKQREELSDYKILTGNLNKLLTTVYYGSAVPEIDGSEKNFTGFSMFYKDDFYLITAGHCIEYEGVKYTDFMFKSNIGSRLVSPRLIYYEADHINNRDFAIFKLPGLGTGLIIEDEDMEPKYVLGNFERNLNYFKDFGEAKEGESGSPILNSGCKLVGIVIKNNSDYTPITEVTRTIDLLIKDQDIKHEES